jgi:hypothetical protein
VPVAVQAAGETKSINGKRGTPVQTDNRFLREDRPPRARAVHFRAGSGCRTGSSGRFGIGGLEGRGFLDGSCSRPDMRLLSERSATSANDQDFTSGYCQKGNRSHRVCRPDHRTRTALATKRLIAKTLHDGRGGSRTLDPMVCPVKNW